MRHPTKRYSGESPHEAAPLSGLFSGVIDLYGRLEPEGADTWNPLKRDRELDYRSAAYRYLCAALRQYPGDLERMQILDVGCGNGRSTRVYLDFGFKPEQLCGIDLRAGAIRMARESHPSIRFLAYDGMTLPIPDGSIDWVALSTVLSSVPTDDGRRHIAEECMRVLSPGGFLFYFDSLEAHASAQSPLAGPSRFFPDLTQIRENLVRLGGNPRGAARPLSGILFRLLSITARRPTHRATLLRKPTPSGD